MIEGARPDSSRGVGFAPATFGSALTTVLRPSPLVLPKPGTHGAYDHPRGGFPRREFGVPTQAVHQGVDGRREFEEVQRMWDHRPSEIGPI